MNSPVEIQPLRSDYISRIAAFHVRYLPGFLTELGKRTVAFFYETSLQIPGNFGWVALDGDEVVGLIFGSLSGAHLYHNIFFKKPLNSLLLGLLLVLTRTRRAVKIAYWLLHPPQIVINTDIPELIYIAVDERYRRFGLTNVLLKNVFAYLRENGHREFQLSVAETDVNVQRFFEGMGARRIGKYQEGGIPRYRYSISV